VRWSAHPITSDNFDSARKVGGLPAPSPAGTQERLRLSLPGTARYLAVRATDDAGNLGAIVAVPIR
jgi:hypothetical protein